MPVAVIDVQKDTRRMKLNVTGANSYDPDGDKLSFLWEFEEGVFDERKNPLIYEFTTPGEKTVRLTVTDSFGDSAQAEIIFAASSEDGEEEEGPELEVFPLFWLFSEVMPSPEGPDDENEWVELYNENSFGVDLSGWYIDDAEGKSRPYRIPEGTVILGDSYMVFSEPDLGLSFKNSEDVVRILDPNKNINQEVEYSDAKEDWSYARQSFGAYEWTPLFTPGEPNEFPPPPVSYPPGSVVFESVLPNPEGDDSGNEKITLKNKLDEEADLTGWTITDASGAEKTLSGVVMGAQESLILLSSEFGLTLNNSDESLTLCDATGGLIDEIGWKDSGSGQWLFNPDSLRDGMEAEVVRVIDGDTFVIGFDDRQFTVRLIGVDTPETVHPFKPIEYYGKQASAFLTDLFSGQSVTLEFDENKIDKYGRVLAYVFLDGEMVNEKILKGGYGYVYTRFPFKYSDRFISLESEARAAGVGLWQNQKVMSVIDGIVETELLAEPEEALPEEDLLLLLADIIPETLPEESPATDEEEPVPDCASEFLKIDSFLPNPQKGEAVEYVRLVNTGTEKICLTGWTLDDITEGGSKPFTIRGGAIASGGVRTFRKQETKLALNNKDDCVSLIDPYGVVADQICYGTTHKNELFTHAGGDWVPKRKAKKMTQTASNTLRHSFGRDLISYQSDLATVSYVGLISAIDETAELMVMELAPRQNIRISYANSPVNMAVTRELIDFNEPVRVRVYETDDLKSLLAIEPLESGMADSAVSAPLKDLTVFIVLLFVSGLFFLYFRRFN